MAGVFLKYNVQAELEYPLHLISWLISNPMQFFFGIITVQVVIANFSDLGGWGFEQIAFLFGLGIISHGLSIVLFIQTWGMGYHVTQGTFDLMLTRPLNVFFQFCFLYLNFIGITDLIPGVIIFIYGCSAVKFDFTLINTLKLAITIIGATALRGGLYTMAGACAFWLKRSGGLIGMTNALLDYSMKYPFTIFPRAVQVVFTFILPISFICYYPAAEFLGKPTGFNIPWSYSVWTLIIGIAVYLIGMSVFNIGLRRYESAGS